MPPKSNKRAPHPPAERSGVKQGFGTYNRAQSIHLYKPIATGLKIPTHDLTEVEDVELVTAPSLSPPDVNGAVVRPSSLFLAPGKKPPRAGATYGTKPHEEEARSLSQLFAPDYIMGTIRHLIKRDWSTMVWSNVAYIIAYHIFAAFGLYNLCCFNAKSSYTYLWYAYCHLWCGLGVTAGMHRLWSHKSYEASKPLEVFLAIGATMAFQNSIWDWCRDHRVHHKYSETEADPHNSHRGIFFAHMGWLMVRKRPDVGKLGAGIEMDDLKANPIVKFQHDHYYNLMLLITIIIPTLAPVFLWNEDLWVSFTICSWRIAAIHHSTWFVNSISHWQGPHPYDNTIYPAENIITGICALGEGWHNYHHRFPSDWRTSDKEFGLLKPLLNFTSFFLDGVSTFGMVRNPIETPVKLVNSSMDDYGNDHERGLYFTSF